MDDVYGTIKKSQTREYIRYEIINPNGEFIMATPRFFKETILNSLLF